MEPVYVDIHIHTSEDPNSLNTNYDIDTLFSKVREKAQGQPILLSLTDHNTINKAAYIDAKSKLGDDIHLMLGVELHIHYVVETDAYHCHMFFQNEISKKSIDDINRVLNKLYPQKVVNRNDQNIPTLDKIITEFDSYDFVLLPHGGQSHATFNKSIPSDKKFDTMMERSVYYNQFDGFTARSNRGREETDGYFKRLGISDFVNLVTCSDNYLPCQYPNAKTAEAGSFIPTWMFAQPTFEGFRLSLSEKSRLVYANIKPNSWSEKIKSVKYKNEKLDIDVEFSSGLNVIIGGSSSGKTLLVDSIARKLAQDSFEDSYYKDFGVENINISNPSNMRPHYLNQNYIMKVVGDDSEQGIEDIEIIRSLFPENEEINQRINTSLSKLKDDITALITAVKEIESIERKLFSKPQIARLMVVGPVRPNIIKNIYPEESARSPIKYEQSQKTRHISALLEIKNILSRNPLVEGFEKNVISDLIMLLQKIYKYSEIEYYVYKQIKESYDDYDSLLRIESQEDQTKTQQFNEVLENVVNYIFLNRKFNMHLETIASYQVEFQTKEVKSSGHTLFIENQYILNKNKVLEFFNRMLKNSNEIKQFEAIEPGKLFEVNHSKQRPKVYNYDDFIKRVYSEFEQSNKTTYKITTKEGRNFNSLSAGWKTSVLLDLILGYDQDIAPIIIDQPEDNLATKYINDGLVKAIKEMKTKKQIILVTHNATIPMMGDAQRIIYCKNEDGVITIRSSALEGSINDKPVLDLIASITDGGKPSIKKRAKKYNLKKFS